MPRQTSTVSIVIPAYNEAAFIAGCLDSIASQTRRPDEVIVVDNNSTDQTAAIARRYQFVRVVNEPVQGSFAAHNRGLREARSTFVARIDSDSRLPPDWVALGAAYLQSHPGVAAITGRAQFYDFPCKALISRLHAVFYYRLQRVIAGQTMLWGANMMLRRDGLMAILADCPVTPGVNEDIYMSLVMRRHGLKIRYVPQLIANVSLLRTQLRPAQLKRYLAVWPNNYRQLSMPGRARAISGLMGLVLVVAVPLGAVWHWRHGRSG